MATTNHIRGENLIEEKYRTYPASDAVLSFGNNYDSTLYETPFMYVDNGEQENLAKREQQYILNGYFIATTRNKQVYRWNVYDLILTYNYTNQIDKIGGSNEGVYFQIKSWSNIVRLYYKFTTWSGNYSKITFFVESITYN